jgi:probable F420-dependent oxidoreductase
MEFDVYNFGSPLGEVSELAREVEDLGFSGMWFTESKHNPFLGCALAAAASDRLAIGTAIAVAFPRSPMVTAQAAWDLAALSGGRFILGLGTQVKAHMERRFSTKFEHPVAKMREYVLALRAIFRAFQEEEPLKFHGDFYAFSLLTEFFSPGPIAHPDVAIYVAGVNRLMARMAGEACDGFHVHPLHSRRYLEEVVRPAIAEGAARARRDPSDISLACPVFMIVGDNEEEIERARRLTRRQLAFYGSTRTYRPVLELHGWQDASSALHRLMSQGDIEAMEKVITDEMLDAFAVTASWEDLPGSVLDRYRGLVDRVFPYFVDTSWRASPERREHWREVATAVRSGGR